MSFRAEEETQMKLKLKARVNRSDAQTIRRALEQLSANSSVVKAGLTSSSSKPRWNETVQEI